MPRPYYDPSRPACDGRWVFVTKTEASSTMTTFHSQAEAYEAAGLPGGNPDPLYRPQGTR